MTISHSGLLFWATLYMLLLSPDSLLFETGISHYLCYPELRQKAFCIACIPVQTAAP